VKFKEFDLSDALICIIITLRQPYLDGGLHNLLDINPWGLGVVKSVKSILDTSIGICIVDVNYKLMSQCRYAKP
jgi:hypothetical protein